MRALFVTYSNLGFIVQLRKDLIQQISYETRLVMGRRVERDECYTTDVLKRQNTQTNIKRSF